MFMLVRTGPEVPKHRGISMVLVDMKTPGITVQPIINAAGHHSFNQVLFDDVRVPKENLVGALNDGWRVGTALLNFERANIDYIAWAQRTLDELAAFAKTATGRDGQPLSKDPDTRRRLAEFDVEIEQARLITYETAWRQGRGETPVAEASMSKLMGSDVNLRVHEYGVELLGMYGQLEPGSPHAQLEGRILKLRLGYISGPILAGTNEIQRNIIAQRGLGLPRE
jgi:alkylation response protein AidB-like acyl-CoA dehydrogenase